MSSTYSPPFLAFQTVAPLVTNGQCAGVEKIMTALLIGTFEIACFLLSFTDSITTRCGKAYYGIVTSRGLYNPKFEGFGLPALDGTFYNDSSGKYVINKFDFINGVLNVVTFGTLAMLTSPITTCYYPTITSTIVKCVSNLVALTVGMFAFAPNARQGVGFAILTGKADLVPDNDETSHSLTTLESSKKLDRAKASLFDKGGNKDSSRDHVSLHFKNAHGNPTFELTPTPPFTPASTPLHQSPNRSTGHLISQMSPNRGLLGRETVTVVALPVSSPIHQV